ncbi:hypothetical protein [Legionella cardiaca]|uniref:Substrate of the Dot/Icm secretion system n=1 Tax=Legionella cardiaca TaxID=1071983 RepID=A0ABY8AT20_9GAMM|nr:hypothetical protein [Legionella cardiaca]WED43619.1 hypothetical protein PXX05_02250 [Legionella cardiaca]
MTRSNDDSNKATMAGLLRSHGVLATNTSVQKETTSSVSPADDFLTVVQTVVSSPLSQKVSGPVDKICSINPNSTNTAAKVAVDTCTQKVKTILNNMQKAKVTEVEAGQQESEYSSSFKLGS